LWPARNTNTSLTLLSISCDPQGFVAARKKCKNPLTFASISCGPQGIVAARKKWKNSLTFAYISCGPQGFLVARKKWYMGPISSFSLTNLMISSKILIETL
jgi:hypothetical protein